MSECTVQVQQVVLFKNLGMIYFRISTLTFKRRSEQTTSVVLYVNKLITTNKEGTYYFRYSVGPCTVPP